MNTLDDLAYYISENIDWAVYGSIKSGGNISLNQLSEAPDDCIGIGEYPGKRPRTVNGHNDTEDRWRMDFPSVQVQVRSKNQTEVIDRAYEIYGLLNDIQVTIRGTHYTKIHAKENPAFLSKDKNGRWVYKINFEIIK